MEREHEKMGAWNSLGLVDLWGNVHEWTAEEIAIGGSFRTRTNVLDPRLEALGLGDETGFRAAMSIPGNLDEV